MLLYLPIYNTNLMSTSLSTIAYGAGGIAAIEATNHIPIESIPEAFDILLKIVIGVVTLVKLFKRPKETR